MFKLVYLHKTLKKLLAAILGINALAGIAHPNSHIADLEITAYGHTSRRRKLQRIIDIMGEDLHEAGSVGIGFEGFGIRVDRQRQLLSGGLGGVFINELVEQREHGKVCLLQGLGACLELRHTDHIVKKLQEAGVVLIDEGGELLALGFCCACGQYATEPDNSVERGADFVADICEECGLQAITFLGLITCLNQRHLDCFLTVYSHRRAHYRQWAS